MSKIRVRDAAGRARALIPFDAGTIRGDYCAVLTPVDTVPAPLRDAQQRRTDAYMSTGARNMPADAPRYVVTSNGALIAHVTMDGVTHYAAEPLTVTQRRHREAIRAVWPHRFDASGPLFRD